MRLVLTIAMLVMVAARIANAAESSSRGHEVSETEMQRVYDEAKTPFKFGIVLRGNEGEKIDCPNVFKYRGRWFMIFIAFDGSGYETRLAESKDLVHWDVRGAILQRHGVGWDAEQAAGGVALVDNRWDGTWEIQSYDGQYWMSYLGGKSKGYETPPLSVGLASTRNPKSVKEWKRWEENPILSPTDAGARVFERDTLFKTHIFSDTNKTLGAQFVMAYNARAPKDSERIGLAISDDMRHWRRFGDQPVIENERPAGLKYGVISGDPQVVKMGNLWVMFYFGAFWKPGAFDTFAASRDLAHWTKWTGNDPDCAFGTLG